MKETSLTEEQKPCWTVLLMEAILTAARRTSPHQCVAQWLLVQLSFDHFVIVLSGITVITGNILDAAICHSCQFNSSDTSSGEAEPNEAVSGLKPWNQPKRTHCMISSTSETQELTVTRFFMMGEVQILILFFCCWMKYTGPHVTPFGFVIIVLHPG